MSETDSNVDQHLMHDDEKDILKQIAYCADGMFDCEVNKNLGDAKEWKRQLKIATDKYYDYLFDNMG